MGAREIYEGSWYFLCVILSNDIVSYKILYKCDLCPLTISRFFLFASPSFFRYFIKCTPYWWNRLFVMYPFVVADSWMSLGALRYHVSWTRWPLWITNGGHTFPPALTKDKTVEVFPCSEETCWNVLMCFIPNTFTSFGTFCMPVSSPDHIWSGDMIPAVSSTSFNSLNQFPITVGFAPIARAMDRLWAFLRVISGWCSRNPHNHFLPAICRSSLKLGIPFTLAYWYASWHTIPIVSGNPLSWNFLMVVDKLVSSSGKHFRIKF